MNQINKLLFVLCMAHGAVSLNAMPTFDEITKHKVVRRVSGSLCVLASSVGLSVSAIHHYKGNCKSPSQIACAVNLILQANAAFAGYLLLKESFVSNADTADKKEASVLAPLQENNVPTAQENLQNKLASKVTLPC